MNTLEFIEYSAKRHGIDDSVAKTMVDMFCSCLQGVLGRFVPISNCKIQLVLIY